MKRLFSSSRRLHEVTKVKSGGCEWVVLPRDTNQVRGLAEYAQSFINPDVATPLPVLTEERVRLFHVDSVLCGCSAIASKTNAPLILAKEALGYKMSAGQKTIHKARVLGSKVLVPSEKAVAANVSAVREWDSNGTVFGFRKDLEGHQAGEFGHNDFYPVVIAGMESRGKKAGMDSALRAMVCIDEIRARLAEVFSLKDHKIDHVLHGSIASAVVYGTLVGATVDEIESAVGMTVAHYVPWRAIRYGHQLSDSKGASAAISSEVAVLSVKRAMAGFVGPKDIFRNAEAIFNFFDGYKGKDKSPFDLHLCVASDISMKPDEGFAVNGMHFKLGLYEHQSAGAISAVISLLVENPNLIEAFSKGSIDSVTIKAYEPAFHIIGDPAKRDPQTRQSADHSMVYIVSNVIRKAIESHKTNSLPSSVVDAWKKWMLLPSDYTSVAINDPATRKIMSKIIFAHGGPEYDKKYPDGIPTSVHIKSANGKSYDSGMVMYPMGHARGPRDESFNEVLDHKFSELGRLAFGDDEEVVLKAVEYLKGVHGTTAKNVRNLYTLKGFPIRKDAPKID